MFLARTVAMILLATIARGPTICNHCDGITDSIAGPTSKQSPKATKVISPDDYDHALDVLFSVENSDEVRTKWEFVLRFKPSFAPESQIILRSFTNGPVVIREWSADGSVWQKLNSIENPRGLNQPSRLRELAKIVRRES